MRLGTLELGDQALMGGRGDDQLPDRARVVERIPERRPQRAEVELGGAAQALLLGNREDQLESDRSRPGREAGGELDQDRDRGLVVGAEDRLATTAIHAVGELDLDPPRLGHGVEVGAEHHPPVPRPRDARDQVARSRAGRLRRVVLDDVDAVRAQLAEYGVRHRPLRAGRARDLAESHEAFEEPILAHGQEAIPGRKRAATVTRRPPRG